MAATGLVRLPNLGEVKWRNADNSGDLGMALSASNHLAMDAIIDFAAGQTFGAFSYPDATTTSKGIVEVDPVGGLAVAAGVASLAATGVVAGTYPKVTVDAKGRVTGGTTLVSGDLPAHTHVATDIVSGALPFTIQKAGTAIGTRRALNLIEGTNVTLTLADDSGNDRVNVTVAASLPAHTHAEADVTELVTDLAGKAARTGDTFTGTLRVGGDQAYLECGPYQTVGGVFENMAKHSEDFSVTVWDKNGGSCSVFPNGATAPDGNVTADQITAVTATPIIQQQIAGLVDGGTYTLYVWAKIASGTREVSIAIVNNGYGAYLAGPTQITLTTNWRRFHVTGTLAASQTGLWIVVRQFDGNGDDWTTGSILLWGACLQQGNDPGKAYARTWGFQTAPVAAGVACGPMVVSAINSTDSPFKVRGPGSNLADHTLIEVTAGGELIIASGAGNGYRLAELMGASNPSGWSGVIKVKNPAGVTAGYILLYSNP
jgi:hypothetical protein